MSRIVWTSSGASSAYIIIEHTLAEFLKKYQYEVFLIGEREFFLKNLRAFAEGAQGIAYSVDDGSKLSPKFFSTFHKALEDCNVQKALGGAEKSINIVPPNFRGGS